MTEWSAEIVRARFVEAMDTERRMPGERRVKSSGYWPAYEHTFKDMNGWGTKRLEEERKMRFRRIPPTSAAISRHDEVMRWTAEIIKDETDRRMVWAWSCCQITGASFAALCRSSGWSKATAYRRIQAMMDHTAAVLCKKRTLLRLPDEYWLRQQQPIQLQITGTIKIPDDEPSKSPTSQIIGDRSRHLLTSPQAIDAFEKHLAALNQSRRKRRAA